MISRAIVAVVVVACAVTSARARDMGGEAALGGSYEAGPAGPALSFRYWVSDLGLQVLYGMDTVESGDGEPGHMELRPSARGLYAFTRTRLTNLYVGVGVAGVIWRDETTDKEFKGAAYFETMLGAELFTAPLSDDAQFSISGQITLSVELAEKPRRAFATPGWGAAFHFYFD